MKRTKRYAALLAALATTACASPLQLEERMDTRTPPPLAEELSDSVVVTRVQSALARDDALRPYDIEVAAEDGRVTLVGDVRSLALRRRATAIVLGVEGVQAVDNQLVIVG